METTKLLWKPQLQAFPSRKCPWDLPVNFTKHLLKHIYTNYSPQTGLSN